jgi:hypothetical protein
MTVVPNANITNDDIVDLGDLLVIAQSGMYTDNDAGFLPLADLNNDKFINNSDIETLADYFATDGGVGLLARQYYYHFDQLGSVVALSDDTGNVIETYKYDTTHSKPNLLADITHPKKIKPTQTKQ